MKTLILPLVLALALPASAQVSFNFTNINISIPDNNPSGVQNSQSISSISGTISRITVTLDLSGGFNNDYYFYLYHAGTSAILLNRVGRSATNDLGYLDAGFGPDSTQAQFTLDDAAVTDIHRYGANPFALNSSGQLTGSWQPDGRLLDPTAFGTAFDAASRSRMLNVFNGLDPNGQWTLFGADVTGGGMGTLRSWGLTITAVPEPSCLGILTGGLLALAAYAMRFNGARRF